LFSHSKAEHTYSILHSTFRFLYGDQARFFNDEIHHDLKHSKTGTVAMASAGENLNASQVLECFSSLMGLRILLLNIAL